MIAVVLAAPTLALIAVALGGAVSVGGTDGIAHLIDTVLPRYAWTTVLVSATVLLIVVLIGVGSAWLIAAYDFPARDTLAWLLVLPMAMPAFVMAYAYTDFLAVAGPLQRTLRQVSGWEVGDYWFPDVHAWPSAAACLGLALYPYVYLLARTAFAERSASLGEAARSLGLGPKQLWWRVVWPVARPAVAAGAVLALMETVADFGTVSYFAVDTFTAGIFRAWQGLGDRAGAAQLATVLLTVVIALIWTERRQRGRMQFHARGARVAARERLQGGSAAGAFIACAAPATFGFALPALLLVRAALQAELTLDPRLFQWAWNTATLAMGGVMIVLPLALCAAYAARLSTSSMLRVALAIANTGYAVPGIVLGVGLLTLLGFVSDLIAPWGALFGLEGFAIGGGVLAVLYAYAVRFFPVGFQGMDAGLRRISPSMDHSARSLGRSTFGVLREVHWPLMRRTLAVSGLLVFVDCVKELPATLVLRPFDFDTLAVMAHHFAADERLSEAALPALVIVLVGVLPVLGLSRIAHQAGSPA